MSTFLLWLALLVVAWPLAVLALILYPVVTSCSTGKHSEKEETMHEDFHPKSRRRAPIGASAVVLVAMSAVGLGACGDDVEDVISFVEYIDATGEVLDANGLEAEFDIDCEGSTDIDEVTCTGTTTEGLSIESTGEDLGDDTATLIVAVDGEVLYDGLLDDARNE